MRGSYCEIDARAGAREDAAANGPDREALCVLIRPAGVLCRALSSAVVGLGFRVGLVAGGIGWDYFEVSRFGVPVDFWIFTWVMSIVEARIMGGFECKERKVRRYWNKRV